MTDGTSDDSPSGPGDQRGPTPKACKPGAQHTHLIDDLLKAIGNAEGFLDIARAKARLYRGIAAAPDVAEANLREQFVEAAELVEDSVRHARILSRLMRRLHRLTARAGVGPETPIGPTPRIAELPEKGEPGHGGLPSRPS